MKIKLVFKKECPDHNIECFLEKFNIKSTKIESCTEFTFETNNFDIEKFEKYPLYKFFVKNYEIDGKIKLNPKYN